jgi:hypothetical protein
VPEIKKLVGDADSDVRDTAERALDLITKRKTPDKK